MSIGDRHTGAAARLLASVDAVVLDFDGTIKNSIQAKAEAFVALFPGAGRSVHDRIRAHHAAHGGVSRTEKLPLYMEWVGISPSPERVRAMMTAFSHAVTERVIASPWIAGYEAIAGLRQRCAHVALFSATPQGELSHILTALEIVTWFDTIHGWPCDKAGVVRDLAAHLSISPQRVLVVGDSREDEQAAAAAGARFVNVGSRITAAPTELDLRWLAMRS